MKTPVRKLDAIAGELMTAMKAESTNFIAIGNLLIEAQQQLEHGDFLRWVSDHFDRSTATAYQYIRAAKVVAKFPAAGNLKLRPSALYVLGASIDSPDQEFFDTAFKEAEEKWVTADRLQQIWEGIRTARRDAEVRAILEAVRCDAEEETDDDRKARKAQEAGEYYVAEAAAAEAALAAKAAAILDGKPPELPPASEAPAMTRPCRHSTGPSKLLRLRQRSRSPNTARLRIPPGKSGSSPSFCTALPMQSMGHGHDTSLHLQREGPPLPDKNSRRLPELPASERRGRLPRQAAEAQWESDRRRQGCVAQLVDKTVGKRSVARTGKLSRSRAAAELAFRQIS
jgi:hypothetical protein